VPLLGSVVLAVISLLTDGISGVSTGAPMTFAHISGVKPAGSIVELGRGADGIVIEVLDHPELVIKDMNHPFKLGRNRVALSCGCCKRLLRRQTVARPLGSSTTERTSKAARGWSGSGYSMSSRGERKRLAVRSLISFLASIQCRCESTHVAKPTIRQRPLGLHRCGL